MEPRLVHARARVSIGATRRDAPARRLPQAARAYSPFAAPSQEDFVPSELPIAPGPRCVVLGISGAGKSTFASALAGTLHVPHIELDALFWGPGWAPKPTAVFRELTAAAVEPRTWVVDGNYSAVRDIVWPRATTLVWLNYPLWLVLWRVLRRTLRRVATREPLWHGNRESFVRTFFSRESILWWVLTAYHRRQREFRHLKDSLAHPDLDWIELRRPSQANALLQSVRSRAGASR
jgi:adenylate kinase family enzyme